MGMPSLLVLLLLLLPLLSGLWIILAGFSQNQRAGTFALFPLTICFLISLYLLFHFIGTPGFTGRVSWFALETLSVSWIWHLNNISVLFLMVVSTITLMVNLFSLYYMKNDLAPGRYYAGLLLFFAAMAGLIVAGDLFSLFVSWELVGFSSFLLIGHFRYRKAAGRAAVLAVWINRIGDVAFLLALLVSAYAFQSWDIQHIFNQLNQGQAVAIPNWTVPSISLLLVAAAAAKSAQIPLQIWLPDAMEGPTPVSALIHAATMVAAGIYLLVRVYFLFPLEIQGLMAVIGAFTALLGALMALFQDDIKRVLAFSTISQLGFMFFGLGIAAYDAAFYHLITHAFFKAGLFLCAGVIIHELEKAGNSNPQHMGGMGNLRKKLPLVFIAYLAMMASLSGLPLFTGFLSKDAILTGAVAWAMTWSEPWGFLLTAIAFTAAFLTPVYMGKQLWLVFFGSYRGDGNFEWIGRGQNPFSRIPLVLLGLASLGIFASLNPLDSYGSWLLPLIPRPVVSYAGESLPYFYRTIELNIQNIHLSVAFTSVLIALLGLGASYLVFGPNSRFVSGYSPKYHQTSRLSLIFYHQMYLPFAFKKGIATPVVFTAQMVRIFDTRVLNWMLDITVKGFVVLAHVLRWVDKKIVDGLVGLIAAIWKSSGWVILWFQGRKVQTYILFSLLILLWLYMFIIF